MAEQLPDWERLLGAAARLQGILPGATLVGGTAAAIDAGHRQSMDADHVIADLIGRFDEVLGQLDSAAGWKTARIKRPVVIYGSLDGILTTVRHQVRVAPLETIEVTVAGQRIRVPTRAEILRIKAWLVVRRNATRDFLDVAAIASRMNDAAILSAVAPLDRLYPQEDDPGAVRYQLMRQLAMPRPFDLDSVDLAQYKSLSPAWHDWSSVVAQCTRVGTLMAKAVSTRRSGWADVRSGAQKQDASMQHRHLTHQRLTLAALDDLLENGTLGDWQPVLARIRRDPHGAVADRVALLLDARDYEETGALWRAFLEDARSRNASLRARH